MKSLKCHWLFACLILAVEAFAQAHAMITMDQEPHHHLSLKNAYVKVFRVEVNPGDSILMHRHDADTIAIAVGDQTVSVGFPDKPDIHQKNPDGQLRLQMTGYVHSTHVDPGSAYHTIAVELLQPQGNPRNVCAAVMAGKPLDCPQSPPGDTSAIFVEQRQFESDETRVDLVRVQPGQSVTLGDQKNFEMIVALDAGELSATTEAGKDQALKPGEFVWFAKGGPIRSFMNDGKGEARLVKFQFVPIDPKGKTL